MIGKSYTKQTGDNCQPASIGEEAELWMLFKEGDAEAFSHLYHQYYRSLYNYGYTLFPDKELLKDTLQELFFELWRDRQKLAAVQAVRIYLLASFRRKLMAKVIRQRKRNEKNVPQILHQESYEEQLIENQNETFWQNRLQHELDHLPRRQKEALYLRFYQELTYQQITELMQLQYQTVRDLVHKALKTLREKLRSVTSSLHLLLLLAFSLPALLG